MSDNKQSDSLVRFLFEELPVRGAWVNLHTSLQVMPVMKNASTLAKQLLGESVAAAVLLSANIKLQGRLAIQARGEGILRLLVAESTQRAGVRGVIELDGSVSAANVDKEAVPPFAQLVGDGYLAVTLLPEAGDSYQGIVPLQKDRLQDCLADYFRQSEQLETALWLVSDGERAAGLLLQAMPDAREDDAGWQHVCALAQTLSDAELLALPCEQLLHRLFHQDPVRVFDAESVSFQCTCSEERSAAALAALGRDDLQKLFDEQPVVDVDCQFCGARYQYSGRDIGKILGEASPVLH
ncbi:MAG: Hsp33 family molecular chaperone HslO [Pseudomonadales bacterium]|nr:Hsp33 family molecular chaperone HslO [Pseudomonadales bacterium]